MKYLVWLIPATLVIAVIHYAPKLVQAVASVVSPAVVR
jgi:hypothetical protein